MIILHTIKVVFLMMVIIIVWEDFTHEYVDIIFVVTPSIVIVQDIPVQLHFGTKMHYILRSGC
jgi:hypothetical protein